MKVEYILGAQHVTNNQDGTVTAVGIFDKIIVSAGAPLVPMGLLACVAGWNHENIPTQFRLTIPGVPEPWSSIIGGPIVEDTPTNDLYYCSGRFIIPFTQSGNLKVELLRHDVCLGKVTFPVEVQFPSLEETNS